MTKCYDADAVAIAKIAQWEMFIIYAMAMKLNRNKMKLYHIKMCINQCHWKWSEKYHGLNRVNKTKLYEIGTGFDHIRVDY